MLKLFLILFSLFLSSVCHAASLGTLSGTVLKETATEKKPFEGAAVRLKIFKDQREFSGAETRTNSLGKYNFQGLETGKRFEYQVLAVQDGVPFPGIKLRFAGASKLKAEPILVFPVTGDPSQIIGRKVTMIETGEGNVMKISESFLIRNDGEMVYDGRKNDATPLYIDLLAGGFSLHFIQGLAPMFTKIEEENHRLRLTNPIRPGVENELRIEYTYRYEYKDREVLFDLSHSFPLDNYTVVLTESNIDLKSESLEKQPPQKVQDKPMTMYRGHGFKPGQKTTFTVTGLRMPKDLAYGFLFSALALVGLFGIFMVWKRPSREESVKSSKEDLETQCLAQLEQIEHQFRMGQLGDDHFEREKERLMEILYELQYAEDSNAA